MKSERSLISDIVIADIKELTEIYHMLNNDFDVISEQLNVLRKNNAKIREKEFWYRIENRIVFSSIEAICFGLKRIALNIFFATHKDRELRPKDIARLEEKEKEGFLPTHKNVKFAFKMAARAIGMHFKLSDTLSFQKCWAALLRAQKKRHALTHPKNVRDLKISFSDHKDTLLAYMGFHLTLMSFLPEMSKAVWTK